MKPKYICITAIICAVILGGSYYAVQVNKQNSIEEQQRIEIEAEKEEKLRQEYKEKTEKQTKERQYDLCVEFAGIQYWDYMELNGTKKDSGSIYAETRFWNTADERKQEAIDNCYNRYLK
jgi:hypothetical protein